MSEEKKKDGTTEVAEENKDTVKEENPNVKTEEPNAQSTGQEGTSGTAEKQGDEPDKPWKNADNARYAEMRRQSEELQRRIAQLESENKESVTDEALRDLGFSRQDLDDSENMGIAKAYVKALAKGAQNPKAEAYEHVYKAKREAQRQALAEQERLAKEEAAHKSLVAKDIEDFGRAYPNVRISDVTKPDSDFMKAFKDVVTNGNVTKYYGIYLSLKGAPKLDEATKNRSNPSVNGSQSFNAPGEISQKEILALPKDKFDEAMAKIRSGKLKLRH